MPQQIKSRNNSSPICKRVELEISQTVVNNRSKSLSSFPRKDWTRIGMNLSKRNGVQLVTRSRRPSPTPVAAMKTSSPSRLEWQTFRFPANLDPICDPCGLNLRKKNHGRLGGTSRARGREEEEPGCDFRPDERKVNNPSAREGGGKERERRSVIFMGSYDRVPVIFSFFPSFSGLAGRGGRRTSRGRGRDNTASWPGSWERDEMNRDRRWSWFPSGKQPGTLLRTRSCLR